MPANNELETASPRILAAALEILREELPLLRSINTKYDQLTRQKGDVIWIPYSGSMTATDVIPGYIPPDNASPIKMNEYPISLKYWREVAFELNDREIRSIIDGVIPDAVEQAGRAIRNDIASTVWNSYKKSYLTVGTPDQPLFPTPTPTVQATNPTGLNNSKEARVLLNKNLAPQANRSMILDTDSEGDASILPAFANASASADSRVIAAGIIGQKQGFLWQYDHLAPYHEIGDLSPKAGWTVSAPYQTVTIENPFQPTASTQHKYLLTLGNTGANTASKVKQGDLFKVAGDPNTYVVLNDANPTSATSLTVEFWPKPPATWNTGSAVTWLPSHQIALAMHEDAIGFVSAQWVGTETLNNQTSRYVDSMTDPDTGLPLRYEVQYFHKLFRMSMDILYGCEVIRPQWLLRMIS